MTSPSSFARRRLVDDVIDHLRAEISSGRLATGSRLPPEAKLTAQLGVSRTTLREAIVVLSHDGLVDVRQGDGTFVRTQRAPDRELANRPVAELLDAKRPVFIGLVRLAASRRTEQDAGRLDQLASSLSPAADSPPGDTMIDGAAALEATIGASAHSETLDRFHRDLSMALGPAVEASSKQAGPPPEAFDYLARSARGIIGRDAESADRHARLWLAAQAAWLAPGSVQSTYASADPRRGPRTSRTRSADSRSGGG